MTATVRIAKIEDREFEGECSACPKTGLRWVAVLTDGTVVGLECAKKILGFRPAPAVYNWIADFTAVAEHVDYGDTHVMWAHKTRNETRETRNGTLVSVGGVRADWTKKGWIR